MHVRRQLGRQETDIENANLVGVSHPAVIDDPVVSIPERITGSSGAKQLFERVIESLKFADFFRRILARRYHLHPAESGNLCASHGSDVGAIVMHLDERHAPLA